MQRPIDTLFGTDEFIIYEKLGLIADRYSIWKRQPAVGKNSNVIDIDDIILRFGDITFRVPVIITRTAEPRKS